MGKKGNRITDTIRQTGVGDVDTTRRTQPEEIQMAEEELRQEEQAAAQDSQEKNDEQASSETPPIVHIDEAAFAKEETVQKPTEAVIPPVVTPEVKPTVTQVKQQELQQHSNFQSVVNNLMLKGTSEEKYVIGLLNEYVAKMSPGQRISTEDGYKQQLNLWKAMTVTLETAPREQFKSLWSIICNFFSEHEKGAMSDDYVHRFASAWSRPIDELNGFQRLIDLIKLTINTNSRAAALKQFDFDRGLSKGLSEEARNRLVSLYKM